MTIPSRTWVAGLVVVVAFGGLGFAYVIIANGQSALNVGASTQSIAVTIVFNFSSMPQSFDAGRYHVTMVYNGTGYEQKQTANEEGYQYMGFATVFNSTYSSGSPQTVPFFWGIPFAPTNSSALPFNTADPTAPGVQPPSANATAFGGNVAISWTKQESGL